jgi:hypothetical protein
MTDSDSTISAIAREMKDNPPAIVRATRRKFGVKRAEAQRRAILLSKARKAGASIPSYDAKKFK